jgi:hypothetical protein
MLRLPWPNRRPRFPGYAAHLVVQLRPLGVWRAWSRRLPRPNGNVTGVVQTVACAHPPKGGAGARRSPTMVGVRR